MTRAPRYVALLRGINVTGRNKIPMAELRDHCAACGLKGVETYIQSGNVVFTSSATAKKLEEDLEYRFIGRHLILLDSHSHVVADFIPDAIPQ